MITKEALQIIQDNLTPRTLGILTVEFNIVEKALDRLEQLEKENRKWREIVGCDLCEALGREILLEENKKHKKIIDDLKLENSNLKHSIDEKNEIICDLEEEVKNTASFYMSKCEKFEKVIEFLKEQFKITLDSKLRISDGVDCIQAFPLLMKSNEVIYDLLKEVLENEKN